MEQPQFPLVDLHAQYLSIRWEMDQAIREVLNEGKYINGRESWEFAAQFASFCDVPHCVPVANGTDAIEIALLTLGIGRGDEVILPAFSFVATMEAVCNVGAMPVLCDIDPKYYTMDPDDVKEKISSRTKAIIPVHLYGQMCDMDSIIPDALDQHIMIIEDAAQAHGATYHGHKAGSMGDINTFSFYPGKNLGAYGDAGAITTRSEFLFTKAKKIANHGRIDKYDHDMVGRNSRMDTLQGAILKVKLQHLHEWIRARREWACLYHERLRDIPDIILPEENPKGQHVYHLFVIRMDALRRDDFRHYMTSQGIETGIHYPVALTQLSVTTQVLQIHTSCPHAEKASHEVVSLPIYPEMTDQIHQLICDRVREYFIKY